MEKKYQHLIDDWENYYTERHIDSCCDLWKYVGAVLIRVNTINRVDLQNLKTTGLVSNSQLMRCLAGVGGGH